MYKYVILFKKDILLLSLFILCNLPKKVTEKTLELLDTKFSIQINLT